MRGPAGGGCVVGEGCGSHLEAWLGSAVAGISLCGGVCSVGHTVRLQRLQWFHEVMLLGDNIMFTVTV